MANHSKHHVDWFSGLCITAIILVCVVTFVGFFFLPSSGLVEEPKAKVEVISSTTETALETNITTLPTEVVVEKFMRQGITIVTNQPGRVEFRNVGGPEDMPVVPQPPSRTN